MIEASDGQQANPGQHTHARLQTNMEEIILACFFTANLSSSEALDIYSSTQCQSCFKPRIHASR